MTRIHVLQPGLLSTIQDLGRAGHASFGVPESGAADNLSLRAGNRILGNPDNAAAIELSPAAARFRFDSVATIVLTGAPMPLHILGAQGNRRLHPHSTPARLSPGDSILIEPATIGCRAYLCVRGGIDVPFVLNSRSTCLLGTFGGHDGRPLRAGDILSAIPAAAREPAPATPTALTFLAQCIFSRMIRVTRSTHSAQYPRALNSLLAGTFHVSPHSDRTGIRLTSDAPIEFSQGGSLISEATPLGAIQLPSGGEPIMLLHDRPVTGGYPIIACVHLADIPALAQLRPGDPLRFKETRLDTARDGFRRREALLHSHFPSAE